jgi:hypothetical protein
MFFRDDIEGKNFEMVDEDQQNHLIYFHLSFFLEYLSLNWKIISSESPKTSKNLMPISLANSRPRRKASYSTMLLVASNSNL